MSHLTDVEFVDLMDGGLPVARRAHLQACETCRTRANEMDSVLARMIEHRGADSSDVPEPSPLFFEHLSARVRDAVAAGPPKTSWRARLWRPTTAMAAGLACLVLAVVTWHSIPPRGPLNTPSAILRNAPPVAVADGGSELTDDIDADDEWAVVRNVADQVDWDDAHDAGISTRPDAVERMTSELTTQEQSELALLLRRELNR
jgi:hypothetical protein